MSERPSVDSAALRRQARRRRILENSEERLKAITGRPVSEPGQPRRESSRNFPLYDLQNQQADDAFGEPDAGFSPGPHAREDYRTDKFHGSDAEDDDDDDDEMEFWSLCFGSPWMKNLLRRRFHLILVSLFIQTLNILKLGYLFFNNIYLPFIVAKALDIWLSEDPFRTDFQEQLALMSAVFSGPRARRLLRAYYVFAVIASDFCLYIFVIVASDKLYRVGIAPYLGY